MVATGILKKPWICGLCRSIVSTTCKTPPPSFDAVGAHSGADGDAGLVLLVPLRVREKRDDGRDLHSA